MIGNVQNIFFFLDDLFIISMKEDFNIDPIFEEEKNELLIERIKTIITTSIDMRREKYRRNQT